MTVVYGTSQRTYPSEPNWFLRGYTRPMTTYTVENISDTQCRVTVKTAVQYNSSDGSSVSYLKSQVIRDGSVICDTGFLNTIDVYPWGPPRDTWVTIGESSSTSFTVARGTSAKSVTLSHRFVCNYQNLGFECPADSFTVTIPAKPSYSIVYNANGGTGTTASQTKWYGDNLTLRANGFTRSGYSFKRWNTNSTDTGTGYNAGGTYTGNAGMTLYAIWNRTVTFNANNGSGAPAAQTGIATSPITLSPTKPTRSGYTFLHWNTKADGTGTTYNAGGTYPANNGSVTLYAIWWRNPSVSITSLKRCDANGVEKQLGRYLKIAYSWTLYNGATSFTSFSIRDLAHCDDIGDKAYTSTPSPSGASGSGTAVVGNNQMKPDWSHKVTITFNDGHYSSTVTSTLVADPYYYRPKIKTATPKLVDSSWNPDTLGKYLMVVYDYDFYKPDGSGNAGSLDTNIDIRGVPVQSTSSGLSAQGGASDEPSSVSESYSESIDSETPYDPDEPIGTGGSSGGLSAQSANENDEPLPFGPYAYNILDPHGDIDVGTAVLSDLFYSHSVPLHLAKTGYKDPFVSSITALRAVETSEGSGVLTPADDGDQLLVELAWTLDTTSTSKQSKISSLVLTVEDSISGNVIATRSYSGTDSIIESSPQTAQIIYTTGLDPADVKTGDEFVTVERQYVVKAVVSDKYTDVLTEKKASRSDIVTVAYFTLDVLGDAKYYNLTTDTSVDSSKAYFERSGFGTKADPYEYTMVSDPEGNPSSQGWYEANGIKPGHGVAIGKPATEEGFHISMDVTAHTGGIVVNPTQGSYREGIRLNRLATDSWADMTIGTPRGSKSGIADYGWFIGSPPTSSGRLLYISHNGSSGNTYFSASSSSNVVNFNLQGTMTLGNGTTAQLLSKTPGRTGAFLTVGGSKHAAGDVNGTVIRLGAGGLTLIGGGEYADNRYNVADLSDGTENLYLGADGTVYIETNANTIANRKTFTFGTDGTFNSPSTIKQNGTAVSLSGHTHSYLPLSGGTETGTITSTNASPMVMKAPNINRDAANPSATQYENQIWLRDKDGENLGLIRSWRNASGVIGLQLGVCNENASNNGDSWLWLSMQKPAAGGAGTWSVGEAGNFRAAIGLTGNVTTHTHSAYAASGHSHSTRLFTNWSGQTTLTLSASAANYTALRILHMSNDGFYSSVVIPSPNNTKVTLMNGYFSSSGANVKGRIFQITGTSISPWSDGREMNASGDAANNNAAKIVVVDGLSNA